MRILITGAGGFIGGNLARCLQQSGDCEVIGVVHTPVSSPSPPGITWVQGDLLQGMAFDGAVDYIIHCAALREFHSTSDCTIMDANLAMTENVADYGRRVGIKGFVFASSVSLHGEIAGDVLDENSGRINPTMYGLSKYRCEMLLRQYQEFFSIASLRLCGIVGPGAKNIWLSRVLAAAQRGDMIEIVNGERPYNNLLHTDDLCAFLNTLMENGMSGFTAFPLASQNTMTIRDVVAMIIEGSASASKIIDTGSDGNSFTISNSFATEHFQFHPADVATSLKKFVAENI